MELQRAITAYLEASGASHASLGEAVGVTHATIGNWRYGHTKPGLIIQMSKLLEAIGADATMRRSLWAEALDCKASELPDTVGL